MNTNAPVYDSPLADHLSHHKPTWRNVGDSRLIVHYGKPAEETAAARKLGLCDLTGLAKVGVKGSMAASWLIGQNLPVPPRRYDTVALADGGIIARTDSGEFLIENGINGQTVAAVAKAALATPRLNPVLVFRTDATFLLSGAAARQVFLQTCGVNFDDSEQAPVGKLVMTRVAGVSCTILTQPINGIPCHRLWLDPTFAVALWESLEEISRELGGSIVGAAAFDATLLA